MPRFVIAPHEQPSFRALVLVETTLSRHARATHRARLRARGHARATLAVWLTHRCHSCAVHAAGCSAAGRQVHCCSSSARNASPAQPVVQQLHCSGSSAYDGRTVRTSWVSRGALLASGFTGGAPRGPREGRRKCSNLYVHRSRRGWPNDHFDAAAAAAACEWQH